MKLQNASDQQLDDLELDLRDVMLDLDPGMLAWTPPPAR